MITAKIVGQNDEDFDLQITIDKREFVFIVWNDWRNGVVNVEEKFPTEHISFNKLIREYIPWIGNLSEVEKNIGINIEEDDDTKLVFPKIIGWDNFNKFIKFLNHFSEI